MQSIPHLQGLQHLTALVSYISIPWALLISPLSITNATIIRGTILNHDHNSPVLLVSASLDCESHDFSKPLDSYQKNADWYAVTMLENFSVRNDWEYGLHPESLCDITV